MSVDDMEPDEWELCPLEDCEATAHVNSYDSDDDAYELVCDERHSTWVRTFDETWK